MPAQEERGWVFFLSLLSAVVGRGGSQAGRAGEKKKTCTQVTLVAVVHGLDSDLKATQNSLLAARIQAQWPQRHPGGRRSRRQAEEQMRT